MALPLTNERLFERTWRPSCPIRPRQSRLRRWLGLVVLVALAVLLAGYAFVTNSERVRAQAESYLQRLVGGPVEVRGARLSLFEGLRLDGVTVRAPDGDRPGRADEILFTARSLEVEYDPLTLLGGSLAATRIIAVDPTVRLVEDTASDTWNFQRLRRRGGGKGFVPPKALPEILLRNAHVDYARLTDGRLSPRGSVGVEAQLMPLSPADAAPASRPAGSNGEEIGHYRFAVQTRGLSGTGDAGPRASGTVSLDEGKVTARLQGVDFAALLDLLPQQAGEWWRRHEIAGRLDVPVFELDLPEYGRGAPGSVPQFRVELRLQDATILGRPEQWLPPD